MRDTERIPLDALGEIANLKRDLIDLRGTTLHRIHNISGFWKDWSTTLTNLTLGNGTEVARYTQIGKLVIAYWSFDMGSTSSVGTSPLVSLPVPQSSEYFGASSIVGDALFNDSGVRYRGFVSLADDEFRIKALNASGTYLAEVNVTSTIPFTWTEFNLITMTAIYEAA